MCFNYLISMDYATLSTKTYFEPHYTQNQLLQAPFRVPCDRFQGLRIGYQGLDSSL